MNLKLCLKMKNYYLFNKYIYGSCLAERKLNVILHMVKTKFTFFQYVFEHQRMWLTIRTSQKFVKHCHTVRLTSGFTSRKTESLFGFGAFFVRDCLYNMPASVTSR